ncbi:MAG: PaaI family thioesterase [Myxococcota bacterium]|nr:PaaI family thioesterase [Myxococcota bacterium]
MLEFPENIIEMINAQLGGFNTLIGLKFVHATPDRFVAELDVEAHHKQPYGLVHGGVYAAMIETVCSTAAALNVFAEGKSAVGLDNATSFLRAVRSGRLRCTARPLHKGRRSHVWDADVRDERDREVAHGRVRMMILEPDSKVDGVKVQLET